MLQGLAQTLPQLWAFHMWSLRVLPMSAWIFSGFLPQPKINIRSTGVSQALSRLV